MQQQRAPEYADILQMSSRECVVVVQDDARDFRAFRRVLLIFVETIVKNPLLASTLWADAKFYCQFPAFIETMAGGCLRQGYSMVFSSVSTPRQGG